MTEEKGDKKVDAEYVMVHLAQEATLSVSRNYIELARALRTACSSMLVALGGEVTAAPGMCLFYVNGRPHDRIRCSRVGGNIYADGPAASSDFDTIPLEDRMKIMDTLEERLQDQFNEAYYRMPEDTEQNSGLLYLPMEGNNNEFKSLEKPDAGDQGS